MNFDPSNLSSDILTSPRLRSSDRGISGSKDAEYISPRSSNNRYTPLRRNLDKRGSVQNLFASADKTAAFEKELTASAPTEVNCLRKSSSPTALTISRTASSPPDIAGPTPDIIHDQLVEIFKLYSSNENSEGVKPIVKKESGIFNGSPRITHISQASEKQRELKKELDRVFVLIEQAQSSGIMNLNIPGKDAKQVRLNILLEVLLKNEALKKRIEEAPELKIWVHIKVIRLLLDDFYTNAHEIEAFLKKAMPLFNELVLIFGTSYEVLVKDETHSLNIYDKFVDKASPTLLLKRVNSALENFGKVLSTIQSGEKSIKLLVRAEEVEFNLADTQLIYSTGMGIYKNLVSAILPALQFSDETISALIANVMGRYLCIGKMSKDEIKSLKDDYRRSWPVGDTRTNVKIDWEGVVRTVTHLINLVKADAGYFKRTEWIRKALGDFSASDIRIHLYACGTELIRDPTGLFKGLNQNERMQLKAFVEAKEIEYTSKIEGNPDKTALLKSKCAVLKELIQPATAQV